MAGHNIINPRYTFINIAHFYTFIKEGPRIRNIEIVRLLPVRVIGEVDILLLLQSGNDKFLIYCIKLGELYIINSLINKNRINYCLIINKVFGEVVRKTKKGKSWTPQKSFTRNRRAVITGKTPEKPERLGIT